MDMLSLVYTISAVVGGGFLVWLNTYYRWNLYHHFY